LCKHCLVIPLRKRHHQIELEPEVDGRRNATMAAKGLSVPSNKNHLSIERMLYEIPSKD
jgi:hypothetical protein